MNLTRRLMLRVCWTCGGTGRVHGPFYSEPCPNPDCPFVDTTKEDR